MSHWQPSQPRRHHMTSSIGEGPGDGIRLDPAPSAASPALASDAVLVCTPSAQRSPSTRPPQPWQAAVHAVTGHVTQRCCQHPRHRRGLTGKETLRAG